MRIASGEASWFDFKFFELNLEDFSEVQGDRKLPGNGGPAMFYKYMPRTGIGGMAGGDVAYVTTSQPLPGTAADASPIKFSEGNFRKWSAKRGRIAWHAATFEQLPTTFHVINGLADLDVLEYTGAEMVEFSAPGIAVSASSMRAVEPL